jgi:high-affinity iron transporter
MDFSSLIPTFIITLREGVEAALVAGIVLACLTKAKQHHLKIWVYLGIVGGLIVSALMGGLFGWMIQALGAASPIAEPLLEGVFSLIAVVLLSWMLIWMTGQARYLKTQVEEGVSFALKTSNGSAWAVFSLVFIAVLREGFETVVFIAAKFQQGTLPALGAIAGIGVAAGIGILMFKWGVRLNLQLFFKVMGFLLLLLVAGLIVTALSKLDIVMQILAGQSRASESLCFYYERFARNPSCVLGSAVWDLSKVLPEDRFPGVLLSALLGYVDRLYLVQAIAYIVFLLTIGSLYFQSLSGKVFFPSRRITRNS